MGARRKTERLYVRREQWEHGSRYFNVVAYSDEAATRIYKRWSAFDKTRPRKPRKNILIQIGSHDTAFEQWRCEWLTDLERAT